MAWSFAPHMPLNLCSLRFYATCVPVPLGHVTHVCYDLISYGLSLSTTNGPRSSFARLRSRIFKWPKFCFTLNITRLLVWWCKFMWPLFIRQMSSGHVCAWCYRMFLSVFICIFPMLFCPNANMLNNSSSYHWHSVWQLAQIQNVLIKRFIYVHTVH